MSLIKLIIASIGISMIGLGSFIIHTKLNGNRVDFKKLINLNL